MLGVENELVLSTMTLCYEALQALRLRMDNVVLDAEAGTYDHLPVLVLLPIQA